VVNLLAANGFAWLGPANNGLVTQNPVCKAQPIVYWPELNWVWWLVKKAVVVTRNYSW